MGKNFLISLAIGLYLLVTVCAVGATTLTSTINMDNGYIAYISTDDKIAGTQFATLNNWYVSDVASTLLNAGTDYYLHVYGWDDGWIAGFLGEFTLSGTDHKFSNGALTLLTNTTDWVGNNTGWTDAMEGLTDLNQNGTWPWYSSHTGDVSTSAHWIWAGNAYDDNVAYFSTKISATSPVPEPASLILLGSGLAGLAFYRRKRK